MQGAFGTVVLVVCAVGVAGAIVTLLLNRRTWDEYGRNQLIRDSEERAGPACPARPGRGPTRADRSTAGASSAGASSAGASAERDEEIRQMMEARNARRRRRGEPELDPEAEIARLSGPPIDDELRAEIRDLVIARNHRRARQGKPALDVEREVEREIAGLHDL